LTTKVLSLSNVACIHVVHEPANALDQLGRPEHFLDQNVQSLAVLGVEAQPACGFRGTLPSAILHALVTTA
jgi:hypothetical protein